MAIIDSQVLIVGSGPAGLVLALTLAQNRIPLRIIEKRGEYHQSQRGAAIQARSLELYNFLGVYDEIKTGAIPLLPVRTYKFPGGIETDSLVPLAPTMDSTPTTPYPNPLTLGQDRAESILRSHLAKLGVEVERSTELVSFQQDGDGVISEILKRDSGKQETREIARFNFLVGADGARGVTRKQLGLAFLGESTPNHLLIGDVYVTGLARDVWHSWKPSNEEMVILRPTEVDGLFYTMLCANPADYPKLSASKEILQEFVRRTTTRDDIIIEGIKGLDEYRPNIRMVNKFSEGRVFIVGDAAHVHSPAGGQGMNSSIQDSFNLAWKLSLVCKRLSPLSILETYSDERLPIIQDMLAKTTELHYRIFQSNKWERPKSLNQLRVNCRWSGILVDEQANAITRDAYGSEIDDKIRAGDRAPDAPGLVNVRTSEMTSLFSIIKPTYHTALLFNPPASNLPAILEAFDAWPSATVKVVLVVARSGRFAKHLPGNVVVLKDRSGHAYQSYKQIVDGGFPVIIVRPD
ncbi:FAD binding domain-containing protein [Abortiporus biennis]|nr:FAD binding domain-containing protein [Abortiporus biennis]